MQKILPFLTMAAMLFLLTACGKDLGIVQGKVMFSGLPCQPGQPDFNVPPCSGPYPKYEIKVYSTKAPETVAVTTMSDENGNFKIILPAGDYVIKTMKGPGMTVDNPFTIEKDKSTPLNLKVSSGIM